MDTDIMQAGLRAMFKDPKLMEMWSKIKDADDSGDLQRAMYNHILKYHHNTPQTMYELDDRIEQLEKKVFKIKEKVPATRAQLMLILSYLRFFENESLKKISSNKKRAKLLSVLFDLHPDNFEDDLSQINLPKSKMRSVKNYEFAKVVFEEIGLDDIVEKIDAEIADLSRTSKKN